MVGEGGQTKKVEDPESVCFMDPKLAEEETGFIEMSGTRSRLFLVMKGGPQGSCISPVLFITYHCDMWKHITDSVPNFYADDSACVVGGRIGEKYTIHCID